MRHCHHPHCELPLPVDAHPNRKYCDRRCVNRHDYLKHREKRKRDERERYHANPEPKKAAVKAYYERNRPVLLAQKRARVAMRRRIRRARQGKHNGNGRG